jgi:hypothetical protein
VNIVGSAGNGQYTGIKINADGTLTPDRKVTLQLAAQGDHPLQYRIETTGDVESTTNTDATLAANVGVWINFTDASGNLLGNETKQVKLRKTSATPAADDFNLDANASVTVTFKDTNGLTTAATATIRLNTRIYQTAHKPLRPSSSGYDVLLREIYSGSDRPIPHTEQLSNSFVRAWPDIFYPTTHSYPTLANGDIDEAAAIAMNGISDASHDAVQLVNRQVSPFDLIVSYDSEGRPVTTNWTTNGTKDYGHMLSSNATQLTSWALNNDGYGDIKLEFEYFYLDGGVWGPPYNPVAPRRGDYLGVYDATDPDAMETYVDSLGRTRWRLKNAAVLRELAAYAGSGHDVYDLKTGARMNSGATGSFTTPTFTAVDRIVLILYTDAAGAASGFKLKSGPRHPLVWTNFDVDPANGQLWIHKSTNYATTAGSADTTQKIMIYDYFDAVLSYDYETGDVIFDTDKTGSTVTVDVSYWASDTPTSRTWLAGNDDLIDYEDASVFVAPTGTSTITAGMRTDTYETDGDGRVVQHGTWDKDRGVFEFDAGYVPGTGKRVFSEYNFHTYLRLTPDDHGDLEWEDPVIVADNTPAYRDYTFADVKITNEGSAMLENGFLKFVARGYKSTNDGQAIPGADGIIDSVLDINRPWDVQKGTADETYNKMAMAILPDYIWPPSLAKNNDGGGYSGDDYYNKTAQGILSQWKTKSFGTLAARTFMFGRAVWVLGGEGGTNYPATTAGEKRCSIEVSGQFYNQTI